MTEEPNERLPPAKRRRLVLRAALEALAITTLLVVLYFWLPLESRSEDWSLTQLVVGLVVTLQMVANLILIGLGVRTLLGAAELGLRRRSEGRSPPH